MSQPISGPVPYRVAYSELARRELVTMAARARTRGLGQQILEAVRKIDARLSVYPQFGEPLRDLAVSGETLWVGCLPPLVVQYVIDEEHRVVFVLQPFLTLPRSGL